MDAPCNNWDDLLKRTNNDYKEQGSFSSVSAREINIWYPVSTGVHIINPSTCEYVHFARIENVTPSVQIRASLDEQQACWL